MISHDHHQVVFGGNITYTCKEDHLFADDIEMESHTVRCETNGSFSNLPLKQCISPKCKIPKCYIYSGNY